MTKISIITLHGMGEQERGYSSDFQEDLYDVLSPEERSNVSFTEVYYQDILQDNQNEYYYRAEPHLDWSKLRRFMLFGFSDAASLETAKDLPENPYYRSQERILEGFKQAFGKIGEDGTVIVVAQSLGCQVVSNYCWDANRTPAPSFGVWQERDPATESLQGGERAFCQGRNVKRLYTTGCNIPLFAAGRPRHMIEAIKPLSEGFRWENYFDADDVLGWPLQGLSPSYESLVTDHSMNAGFLLGWSPLSHTRYWKDKEFLRPLARDMRSLMV